MSSWSQYRMMDIMRQIDLALVAEDIPEGDLDKPELFEKYGLDAEKLVPEKKNRWKKIALLSGIAASSIALTGVVVLMCKKHDVFKKAA